MRSVLSAGLLLCLLAGPVLAQTTYEEELQKATLDMFDGKWREALDRLQALRSSDIPEEVGARVDFYEARALEKLDRPEDALRAYERFTSLGKGDQTLIRQARISLVRLAAELYREGRPNYIDRTVSALKSPDPELRFIAAVELSYLDTDSLRKQAVPVLLETYRTGSDAEMRNQASVALLRIDPKLLEKPSEPIGKSAASQGGKKAPGSHTMFKLLIKGSDGEEIRLTLPVSLARMALAALPEDARKSLREKGINPDNLLEELTKASEVLEVRSSEGIVRLWVE